MYVGHPGHVDIPYTVTKRRTVTEVLDGLSVDAPERAFFEVNLEFLDAFPEFLDAFPDGQFHCWGIPPRAKPAFEDTNVGDLILFAPWIGIHDGGIHQLGIVKAKCPKQLLRCSKFCVRIPLTIVSTHGFYSLTRKSVGEIGTTFWTISATLRDGTQEDGIEDCRMTISKHLEV